MSTFPCVRDTGGHHTGSRHWARRIRAWQLDVTAIGLAAVLVVVALWPSGASAQLATFGEQLAQTGVLGKQVAEQAKTVTSMIDQYKTLVEQMKQMVKAGANPGAGMSETGLANETKRLVETKAAFKVLYDDVTKYNQMQEARFSEANQKGMSFHQYMRYEYDAINAGNRRAVERLKQEERMLQAIQDDHAAASRWAGQIEGTEGIHQAVGLLNAQLNRYVQQQARVTQLLAQAQGSDKAVVEQEKARHAANARRLLQAVTQHNARTQAEVVEGVGMIGTNHDASYTRQMFQSGYTQPAATGAGK